METTRNKQEIEIDLKQLFFILLDKVVIIILSGIILALAAYLGTKFFVTPMYSSTSSIYIMNRQNSENTATNSDVASATSLTKDFEEMVISRLVLDQVIESLQLNMSAGGLAQRISIYNRADTRILKITVQDADPYQAKMISDAVAEVASVEIVKLMGIEKVNLIDSGTVAVSPSSPNVKKNALIAGVLGVFLACFVIILMFVLDDTFKSSDDVEKYLGVSVLGLIPLEETQSGRKRTRKKKKSEKKKN